ncbi:transposase [Stieleria sp. TO1_6]|uniref:REP-associated tyrosine transposase n=1 Tax=Stieleria tagensis TaxID=2956795 RepID=UPI00209BA1F8|nr:transposase [Stieleria tagensis]MCO8122442.1 transposase [Stieleria tagensis]
MSHYRRNFVPGGTYFFTLVTYGRRPILTTALGRRCLRESIAEQLHHAPFQLFAICLLPDHVHSVWIMPPEDADYPTRIQKIKRDFSCRWLEAGGTEATVTVAEKKEGRRGIWQPRYWEHTVVDETDLERCVDYLHWNPRKHNLVQRVRDWEFSSFHRFVDEKQYHIDWGGTAPKCVNNQKYNWGE